MTVAQLTRLNQIGDQMQVELITADLMDEDTLKALRRIVEPIAQALNIDMNSYVLGPPALGALLCHDPSNGGNWGYCATCGIVTVIWEDKEIARNNLVRHMRRAHPSFKFEISEMESTSS